MNNLIDASISNLGDAIERSFNQFSNKAAFNCLGQILSYAEIDEKSRAFACWLQQETNLQAGDRIIIQLPNITQYPIAAYAALRVGLVLVNTNPLYTPKEMQHQFSDSGAKAIVILEDLLPKLDQIKNETQIETVITCSPADLITGELKEIPGCTSVNKAIELGMGKALNPRVNIGLDDTCILQYTGGTTGVSKGAELSHRNILSNSLQLLERLDDGFKNGDEVFVSPLPLYHIYAFMVNIVSLFNQGSESVLIPNPRDLDAFIKAIKPVKFTGFAGINTLFVGLCMMPEFKELDFSNLKLTLSGGSALTSDAVRLWKEVTGGSISEGYGLSETSPVLCLNEPGNEHIGTVGTPVIDTVIEIWDENNKPLPQGKEGQIVAKGAQVMKGYWNRPDETEKVMHRGFFKTGDVGKVMEDGTIKIVDRLKDMIIVSGFNVYPNEVEEVLTQHSSIVEAAVIGQPDQRSGEKVCAYMVTNNLLSKEEVIEHCRQALTSYKVPKEVIFMEELPKSTVGKILRRELR